ncbi:hypothetical protein GCM10023116_10050 [Kistimonas scapharcae]|uniref:DUF945 family protein n=1 Tax=Kistimonas scapharcae TaxID=1036133 RepID=A0ABP8UYN1_9GAMM
MSQRKKRILSLGLVAGVIGATALLLPAISGQLINGQLSRQIQAIADTNHYTVSQLELNKGYTETQLTARLEGKDLRKLNGESITLEGTIHHGTLLSLPNMATASLDLHYAMTQEPMQLDIPGKLTLTQGWGGRTRVTVEAGEYNIPLDPESDLQLQISGTQASYDSGMQDGSGTTLNLTPADWKMIERGEQVGGISFSEGVLTLENGFNQWLMTIPELTVTGVTPIGVQTLLSIADLKISNREQVENDLLSSTARLETGAVVIPMMPIPSGKEFINSLAIQFSAENLSVPALQKLLSIGQSMDSLEAEQGREELLAVAIEFTRHLPRFAIDSIDLDTVQGSVSLGFSVQGNQHTGDLLTQYLNEPPVTEADSQALSKQALNAFNSTVSFSATDSLISWGCEHFGSAAAMADGNPPSHAKRMANMCQEMAISGDFLMMACDTEVDIARKQLCLTAMEEVRKPWVEERKLMFRLEEGIFSINDVPVELPVGH